MSQEMGGTLLRFTLACMDGGRGAQTTVGLSLKSTVLIPNAIP